MSMDSIVSLESNINFEAFIFQELMQNDQKNKVDILLHTTRINDII